MIKEEERKDEGGGQIGGLDGAPKKKDEGMSVAKKVFFGILGAVALAVLLAAIL